MLRSILLAILGLSLVAWTNRVQVTSEWNQRQAMQSGVRGPALPLISAPQQVQVPCEATLADYGASMQATAALACANTGPIVIGAGLFDHVALELSWTRDAGTALTVQCDVSYDSMATWGPIMIDTPQGRDIWTRTAEQSVDGRLVFNFQTAAEVVRCRFWVDNAIDDTVTANVTLGRQASFMDPYEYRYTAAAPLPISGTVTADQGASAAATAPWYVRLSDGTDAISSNNRLPVATVPALTALGSLTDIAANAAAGDRTLTIDTSGYSGLSIVINLTWVAATDLTMVVRARSVASGLWGVQHSMAIAAGTVTLSPVTYTRPVSADAEVLIELPVAKYAAVELLFAAPGGGATDLISVQTAGVAGE